MAPYKEPDTGLFPMAKELAEKPRFDGKIAESARAAFPEATGPGAARVTIDLGALSRTINSPTLRQQQREELTIIAQRDDSAIARRKALISLAMMKSIEDGVIEPGAAESIGMVSVDSNGAIYRLNEARTDSELIAEFNAKGIVAPKQVIPEDAKRQQNDIDAQRRQRFESDHNPDPNNIVHQDTMESYHGPSPDASVAGNE